MKTQKQLPSQVECDNCKEVFHISVQEDTLPGDGRHIYYICPNCETEYTILRLSRSQSDLLDDVSAARKRMQRAIKAGDRRGALAMEKRYRKLKARADQEI